MARTSPRRVSLPAADDLFRPTDPSTEELAARVGLSTTPATDFYDTVIRRTVKFSDSTVAGEPITSYASASAGAESYRQLAKEVLARCPDA